MPGNRLKKRMAHRRISPRWRNKCRARSRRGESSTTRVLRSIWIISSQTMASLRRRISSFCKWRMRGRRRIKRGIVRWVRDFSIREICLLVGCWATYHIIHVLYVIRGNKIQIRIDKKIVDYVLHPTSIFPCTAYNPGSIMYSQDDRHIYHLAECFFCRHAYTSKPAT